MIFSHRYHYPPEFHLRSLETLETALNTASAYTPWRALDPGSIVTLEARYDALPALNKQMIRDSFPGGLVPNYRDLDAGLLSEEVEYTYTSGTTSERVINIWDQAWWDRSEAASWRLNATLAALSHPQREAKLASSLNVGISCEEDLPLSHRLVGEKLYLNEKINLIQWMPRHYRRMAEELRNFQPVILEANPSLLARLAYWAEDEGVQLYSPQAIVFTYELPSLLHLAAIRRAFTSPLISSYGTTETGFVLEECSAGHFHQNLDFCRLDFQPLKEKYGGPEVGRLFVTTFGNPWNSVIRFDVGDLVRLHPEGSCACGIREGMIIEAIEGRVTNSTFTTTGGLVTTLTLDRTIAQLKGVRDYHFEQHTPKSYELQLMPAPDAAADLLEAARQLLSGLYGADGEYTINMMPQIWPGPAGKFRRTQANFAFDEGELFV